MQLLIETQQSGRYRLLPDPDVPDDLICEDRSYKLWLVAGVHDPDLAGCHLLLGDVDQGAGRYERPGELSWRWDVSDYVGRVTVGVERDGQVLLQPQEIITDPNRNKLTREQFAAMVDDINAEAAIAYSLSPATRSIDLGQRRQILHLAQLEYIRQQIDPLRRAVEAIAHRPRRILIAEDRIVDLVDAGVSDDRSIAWMLKQPANLLPVEPAMVPAGARALYREMREHLPRRVQVTRTRISHDVYENRLLKHFLQRLCLVLRHSQQRLKEVVSSGNWDLDERVIRLARRRLKELDVYRRLLYNLLAVDFLREVSPLRALKPVTPTLRRAPHYARFYTLYRRFDRAITPFDGAPFRLSLEKTWQLYEYWCFFQVVAALRQVFEPELAFDARAMMVDGADRISLALKEATIVLNPRVHVHFQKTYGYYGQRTAGSYSHDMRPDISIEMLDDAGNIERIILLDPKYRVSSQSLNQAMDDLHCYKDALVGPGQQRLVHSALALCPSSERAKGLYFRSDYIRSHGLGASVLQPGNPATGELLASRLAHLVFDREPVLE